MVWWIWMIVGLALLSLEMFAIDAQFYLVFIGLGAMVVGLIELTGIDMPPWAEWVLFGAVSLVLMFTIRRQMYDRVRGQAVGLGRQGHGDRVQVGEDLPPGESCRTEYRGTMWTATNIGSETIPSGATAVIDAIEGLDLRIRLPD
jgi:hypothetical protein